MNEKKKDNAFVRWTEKHAEIWKFIKFMIAGGGSSAVELVVHMVLLATVFKPFLDQPITNDALNMIGIESKGYLYTVHLPNLHHRGLRHRLYPKPKDHL